jgi:hypothetical protein
MGVHISNPITNCKRILRTKIYRFFPFQNSLNLRSPKTGKLKGQKMLYKNKMTKFIHKLSKAFIMILKSTNLIDIMNKLVHLPEPCMCILVLEICSHGPYDMICASNASLKRQNKKCFRKL